MSLVAAIAIMEKSELGDQARGNSVFVLRALSKVVRCQSFNSFRVNGYIHVVIAQFKCIIEIFILFGITTFPLPFI